MPQPVAEKAFTDQISQAEDRVLVHRSPLAITRAVGSRGRASRPEERQSRAAPAGLAATRSCKDHTFMRRPRSSFPRAALTQAVESAAPPPGAVSPWVALRSASRHPFIYKRMIARADEAARPGDMVNVYDKSGKFFGRGLYNPRSQIALRMLAHGDVPIDDAFWRQAIERAVALRRTLRLDDVTDAYRLIHAEGDGLSGLIVERYADCLVFEFFSLGMFQRREMLAAMLTDSLGAAASLDRPGRAGPTWRVAFRADRQIEQLEGFSTIDEERLPASRPEHSDSHDGPTASSSGPGSRAPGHIVIREHGIRYRVDVAAGHKTGFFCDQRDNRRRFAALCGDAAVLDLCCYTGGFGLCARLLGGARSVTSVDLDEAALAVARENVNLNNTRIDLVHSDVFIYLRQMIANGRRFDAVVLDPPKLALTRDDIHDAVRRYHDLNSLAMQVVRPGGILLTCSCSGLVSREVFLDGVQRAGHSARRTLQLFDQTGAAPDHPIMLNCPESAYLKALWFRVA